MKQKNKNIDKLLGGAIVAPIGKNVDVPEQAVEQFYNSGENIHRFLQDMARQEFDSNIQLRAVADSLVDYRPRNIINYNQYVHHFHAYPENKLMTSLEKAYSGHGSSKDHPKLHQLFMDSFQHHPELVSMYTNR
jgi:hypothetical protein